MTSDRGPTPDMPLSEWLEACYIAPRKIKKNWRWRLRRSVRLFSQFLRRPATVVDLKPALLPGFQAWLDKNFAGYVAQVSAQELRTFCRSVGTMKPPGGNPKGRVWNPDANGKQVKVSDAAGTLWHVCLTLYFPRAIRITSEKTRIQYKHAMREFCELLGRDPTIADLTDDNCVAVMQQMKQKGRAAETINNSVGRIKTLWEWLARRRMVENFPTFQGLKEPKRIPKAWTRDEMDRLLDACRKARNSRWWVALHLLLWDTSERIGAAVAIKREWLNWQTGDLSIPAECRKGQESDASYKLHPDTVAALRELPDDGSGLLFGEPCNQSILYYRYKTIRKAAGLPLDAKSAFHRIRRSVASHLHAAGHNATDALGHQSADVTRKHYLDPALTRTVRPADVLFRPGKRDDDTVIVLDLPPGEARRLPRAKLLAT